MGLVLAAAALAGCGDDGEPDATPTTTALPASTTTLADDIAPTSTTETTIRTEFDPADDGIDTPEDAAVFLLTSWVADDPDAAKRYAPAELVDELFASPAPPIDSIELIECDSSDLETFDCFFSVDGEIFIIQVVDLRITQISHDEH